MKKSVPPTRRADDIAHDFHGERGRLKEMKIYSSCHVYIVLSLLSGTAEYFTRLVENEEGRRLLLLTLVDPFQIRRLVPLLYTWEKHRSFTDLVECFPIANGFCAVWVHPEPHRYQPLFKAMAGVPPALRAEAVRMLVGGLISQDVPYPVLCDVLRLENLFYSPDGQVKWMYHLTFGAEYDRECGNKGMIMLAEIIRRLFADSPSPSLNRFLHILESGGFKTLEEVYAAFAMADEKIISAPTTIIQTVTLKERLEGAHDWFAACIFPIAMIAVMAVGVAVTGYLFIYAVICPPPVDYGITEIGTVKLYDSQTP